MTIESNVVRFEGEQIILGARTYILPPMSLATRSKDIATRKAMVGGHDEASEQELVSTIVLETLQRNYPGLQLADIQDEADFPQLLEAYAILKEQEARLIAEMGKRRAAVAMAAPDAQ